MILECKFINASSYDFTDGQGRRIVGTTANCFDTNSKSLIKVKVRNATAIEGKKFADDIRVNAIPNGRYINYEV